MPRFRTIEVALPPRVSGGWEKLKVKYVTPMLPDENGFARVHWVFLDLSREEEGLIEGVRVAVENQCLRDYARAARAGRLTGERA